MTEHEMIMLGVLNKKKCLPLKSFAREVGEEKVWRLWPHLGEKKKEKNPTFTVLHLARLSLCASHPQH